MVRHLSHEAKLDAARLRTVESWLGSSDVPVVALVLGYGRLDLS